MEDTKIDQNISMEGNQKDFNIVGRDLKIITNQHYRPEFFNPCLDDYGDPPFISPMITPTLVELTVNEGFLLLGGDGYNKSAWARHVAWKVLKQNPYPENSIEVKEWASSSNPQNLELHIQKEEKPTIFILPNISPLNVDYDLSVLHRTARKGRHYIVISTNKPLEKWKLEENIKRLSWEPESSEPLYEKPKLVTMLSKRLSEVNGALPPELKDKEFREDMTLPGNLRLGEAAEKLKTPESIDVFVKSIISVKSPLNESLIRELLDNCQNDRRALRQWFYRSLSNREQLIALGLCLFDGFYDDQFFAAMEKLVEQSWHKRDSSLRSLDYCDMDALSSYYRLNPLSQDGIQKVESHLTEQRQKLMETVWNSHRRQIFAALPLIEKLVKDSVAYSIENQELFGTTKRRRLLREVLGETLCSIGLKPANSIKGTLLEGTLLKLAAEENLGVQAVVARAMAQWRFYDQDEKLFNTLKRWQNDKIMKMLKSFLDVRYSENSKSPKIFIKATVVLTVGFAALHDPPNQLKDTLCDLLKQLAEDSSNRFIRIRFAHYTLPLVVRFHAAQLREMLYDMAREPYLNEPIGVSLAIAVQEGSEEAGEIIESWFQRCSDERPRRYSRKEITHREAVMATVAYAYGWIEYDNEKDGLITIDEGFQRLSAILQNEDSPFVRHASIVAIIRQMVFNFEKVENHLKHLFARMHEGERTLLVDELVNVHLQQRAELENEEEYFTWRQGLFPVWINRARPLTTVERVMQKWLKETDSEEAAQIALEFDLSDQLMDFKDQEKTFINQQKEAWEKMEQQNQEKEFLTQPVFRVKKKHRFTIWLVSWLVAFTQKKYRDKIRWLLPILLKKKDADQDKMKHALKKLYKYSDDEINIISDKLAQALFMINRKEILLPALAGVLILLAVGLVLIFR